MNTELEAIRDAMDPDTGGGRDEQTARQLADEYVANHSAEFAAFPSMTVQQLVEAVDVFRAANMLEDQWRVETWLLHRFEPQNIGGPAQPQVRVPGAE
ncbi:hypothetical protein [Mycobacterium xenopi]|uniref:Uncharacterized protein n=1 Tax=Mycobacterium xenopi TaxID=1789 RepID=A0AAD1GZA1_MYCXE|nr:hypothetical protein [Mycobacterium xenopi]ORX21594.1 hypothetical protein AWC32_21515 [Mycobacterium xenopi]BBU22174.1 hypothetical protein MYXE_19640 [Mycobacterium xenopi]SPX78055.1 Uncharacterised protein [Mycobacterium xenopi]